VAQVSAALGGATAVSPDLVTCAAYGHDHLPLRVYQVINTAGAIQYNLTKRLPSIR